MIASISIEPIGDATVWLAHELEHVIEQVERLRLDEAVRRDRGRVWQSVAGAFETQRAIHAGRLVATEMRDAPRVAARRSADPMPRGDD